VSGVFLCLVFWIAGPDMMLDKALFLALGRRFPSPQTPLGFLQAKALQKAKRRTRMDRPARPYGQGSASGFMFMFFYTLLHALG